MVRDPFSFFVQREPQSRLRRSTARQSGTEVIHSPRTVRPGFALRSRSLGVTAIAVDEALTVITKAEHARDVAFREFRDARDARDAARAKLKSRLSGLREELNRLISADDNRWA